MEQLITTGFAKIFHSIPFQPKTPKLGKDLFESGHYFDVAERRVNGISKEIVSKCCRQTSIRSDPYSVKLEVGLKAFNVKYYIVKIYFKVLNFLQLDAKRNMLRGSCTCVYNKSEKCKHIAGLIHYINNERRLSKTDCEQQWGKPSHKALMHEKYSKVPSFKDLFPKKIKKIDDCVNQPPQLSELKSPSHLKSILAVTSKKKEDLAMELLLKQIEKNHGINNLIEECKVCLQNLFLFLEDYPIYKSNLDISLDLTNFFNNNICLSQDKIIELCCATIEQSACKEWFNARKFRISASSNVHAIKSRKSKSVESLVDDILNSKNFRTEATEYGIKNEPENCT